MKENCRLKIKRNKREIKIRKKKELAEIKKNIPDQNKTNLTNKKLSQYQQSLLKRGSSFVSKPKGVNRFNFSENFDQFTNQLRIKSNQEIKKNTVKIKTTATIKTVITSSTIAIMMEKYQNRNIKVTSFTDLKIIKIDIWKLPLIQTEI